MTISVVMTLYNGSKYVTKQLDSIKNQSMSANEIIIADDCSTDNSFELVKTYVENNGLARTWKVYKNPSNLGFASNFFSAMKKATGDIIFLSDQDDIWELEKMKDMVDAFQKNTEIIGLICKENRIDENDAFIHEERHGTGALRKVSFQEEIRECLGAGHLLAIRREFVNRYISELEVNKLTFDVPLCIMAAKEGGFFVLDSYLVRRRIHKSNTSDIGMRKLDRVRNKEHYLKGRRTRLSYFTFAFEHWGTEEETKEYKRLYNAISVLKESIVALEQRKVLPLLHEVFLLNPYINKKISLANIIVYLKG